MSPTHWVVCKSCGRKFDIAKKGGVYDGSRYYCKPCAKEIQQMIRANRANTASTDEADSLISNRDPFGATKQKPWFSRNWKIVIGIFFLIGGIGLIEDDIQIALFWILLGAGLMFLQFLPKIKSIRYEKFQNSQKEAEIREKAEAPKFCRKCGAKTKGDFCEYCGSKLD